MAPTHRPSAVSSCDAKSPNGEKLYWLLWQPTNNRKVKYYQSRSCYCVTAILLHILSEFLYTKCRFSPCLFVKFGACIPLPSLPCFRWGLLLLGQNWLILNWTSLSVGRLDINYDQFSGSNKIDPNTKTNVLSDVVNHGKANAINHPQYHHVGW